MPSLCHISTIFGAEGTGLRREVDMIPAIFAFVALPVALFFIPMMLRGKWLLSYVGLMSAVLMIASNHSRHSDWLDGSAGVVSDLYWAWLIAATLAGVLLGSAISRAQDSAAAHA
jgi:hypothetical protein